MQKNGAENEKTAALAATDGGEGSLYGFKELKELEGVIAVFDRLGVKGQ